MDLKSAPFLGKDADRERDRLTRTIRSYLIPRVENPDAPFLVVVAGPTGSGKSTLVNSLAGMNLADTGAVRPTTRSPLILTGTDPSTSEVSVGGVDCRVAVGKAPILKHMSLVDTPDIDSTASRHREMAETLVDHADVVVFVTSAIRYADQVPWEVLRRARSRGAVVIPVLNRVGPDGSAAAHDFGRRLGDAGLDDHPVRVPEHHLGEGATKVPSLAVRELKKRLYAVARDRSRHQRAVVNRVLNSTSNQIRTLTASVTSLAAELDAIESAVATGITEAANLPERNRPWASFPLPPCPEGRRRARQWMKKSDPKELELGVWEGQVEARLVAELHTRLMEAIRHHAGPVRGVNPRAVTAVLADARALLEEAVDGWVEQTHERAKALPHPRLASASLTSAALTGNGHQVAIVLGPDPAISAVRKDLQERLDVVFGHLVVRLVEAWRHSVGDPAVDEVAGRLAAVMTAYQFADA